MALLGFDSIVGNGDSINQQLPVPFQIINPDGASIVAGRQTGNALRLSNGAYLQCQVAGNSRGYFIYSGCAFKASDAKTEQALVQISHGGSYAPPYGNSSSYKAGDAFLVIKNGNICLGDTNRTPLFSIVPDVYYYIELRHQFSTNRYNGGEPVVEIWVNGVKAHQATMSSVYGSWITLAMYWCAGSLASGIDIDDLYVLYFSTNSSYAHSYTDNYMPILAGGKINTIKLTSTQSNTFTVEGAATAHEALSDTNEATYITSQHAAEAALGVDPNIGKVFAANLVVRGSSDTEGVLSTLLTDSSGADISGSKQTIALSAEPRLFLFGLVSMAQGGAEFSDKIKAGTTFKVNT